MLSRIVPQAMSWPTWLQRGRLNNPTGTSDRPQRGPADKAYDPALPAAS